MVNRSVQTNRIETMAAKLDTYAQRAGAPSDALLDAYHASVQLRLTVLGDVFHAELLHPARTALILLEDVPCTDAAVLAAAALVETEYAEMRPGDAIVSAFGPRVSSLVREVPAPIAANEELLEKLVSAPRDVALISVAERLDHARHLHFRDPSIWHPFFAQIVDVYLPFSGRISEQLHARLARWSETFGKRRLA